MSEATQNKIKTINYSIENHLYQTGDGVSIFFSPKNGQPNEKPNQPSASVGTRPEYADDHLYQTGDRASIFFSVPAVVRMINLETSGLMSLEPRQIYAVNGKFVRLYEFTRSKRTAEQEISFESVLEDVVLLTINHSPNFIGNEVMQEILPRIQELGKIFNKTVYSPCKTFMNEYKGKIFGFKIFGQKEDQISKHNYCKTKACVSGFILVVCEK